MHHPTVEWRHDETQTLKAMLEKKLQSDPICEERFFSISASLLPAKESGFYVFCFTVRLRDSGVLPQNHLDVLKAIVAVCDEFAKGREQPLPLGVRILVFRGHTLETQTRLCVGLLNWPDFCSAKAMAESKLDESLSSCFHWHFYSSLDSGRK
ncbi:MAG: hypothetical protein AAF532_02765 [Planctomycetota bacterium]